jgi:BlaI family transcriptional regulator, penicillinase repressor
MTDLQLTDLQLHILDVLWSRPEASVLDVQEALRPERELAQSTVATLLSRLERKQLVTHRVERRQFIYRALVGAGEVRESVASGLASLTDRLFGGDVAELVSHLLASGDVKRDDLQRVRRMIEARERELGKQKGER